MNSVLEGDWTSNDFIDARNTDTCKTRISNSSKRSEHTVVLEMRSPSVMKIQIENESKKVQYFLEILPRDLLVPLYKQASLIWLKLLFGKAVKGETKLTLNYITFGELKVNAIFLPNSFTPSRSVDEEDAAAISFGVTYELEGKSVNICLQIPRTMEDGWIENQAPNDIDVWGDSKDLYHKNQMLQEMLLNLHQENAMTVRQFQNNQQEILNLKTDLR